MLLIQASFLIPQELCHGNQFIAKFGYMHSFGTAKFQNRLQYRHSDSKIFNGNILPTSCAILMKIGPLIPEITRVTNAPYWKRRQKSAYPTEYLSNY